MGQVVMETDLANLLDRLSGIRILVVGDAILDRYLAGSTSRLCREAPVPVVGVTMRQQAPGGAGNAAANASALGGQVTFLSLVGRDPEGRDLCRLLQDRGVSVEPVAACRRRRTLTKSRVNADGQMLLRFDEGSAADASPDEERRLRRALTALMPGQDAVIVSDYGYGTVSPSVIDAITELQTSRPRILVVDSRHQLTRFRSAKVTAVKPNYAEAAALLDGAMDVRQSRPELLARSGRRILEMTGAQVAAVTLDQEGALIFEREGPPYRTYARPARHAKTTGAGDTFISALTLALTAGAHVPLAAELASAAAAVVTAKDGTAVATAQDVREYASHEGKVLDESRLAARVRFYRAQGRRIVFTNGCFDLLHRGHITYLSHAKALGDVLIAALNSDESVRALKGPGRPINPLRDRLEVLAALSCVDHLIAFDGLSPTTLLRLVRPDVYVKGGDYTKDTLPEAALVESLGGVIHFLPYVDDRSTSGIIQRIQGMREADSGRTAAHDPSAVLAA
ncbi:MAG TPA: D-glycero-beta-D-manno-heptose 1-phosphate adenylyltransferase [Nitrospira sp.]|nr:D-glycero-beta-D-manno-heptose 1-phosphate adenylyltransferase [Nitrospira sp.]